MTMGRPAGSVAAQDILAATKRVKRELDVLLKRLEAFIKQQKARQLK